MLDRMWRGGRTTLHNRALLQPRLRWQKASAFRGDRIDDASPIEEQVPCLAACLGNEQAAMARCPVEGTVVVSNVRHVIGADWVIRTQAKPLDRAPKHEWQPRRCGNQAPERALGTCTRGVNQDAEPVLSWVARIGNSVNSLLQRTKRVTAVKCNFVQKCM